MSDNFAEAVNELDRLSLSELKHYNAQKSDDAKAQVYQNFCGDAYEILVHRLPTRHDRIQTLQALLFKQLVIKQPQEDNSEERKGQSRRKKKTSRPLSTRHWQKLHRTILTARKICKNWCKA